MAAVNVLDTPSTDALVCVRCSALGLQMHALELSDQSEVDARSSLASELMAMYEAMGNGLARQVRTL